MAARKSGNGHRNGNGNGPKRSAADDEVVRVITKGFERVHSRVDALRKHVDKGFEVLAEDQRATRKRVDDIDKFVRAFYADYKKTRRK